MSNKKEASFQDILDDSNEDYNPKDIRTYTCKPLCSSPYNEILTHLSLEREHKTGNRSSHGFYVNTPYGGHFANSNTSIDKKVSDMVINFPKASEFSSLKPIKSVKLPTLYPSWMIERYEMQEKDKLVTFHKTPIYYNLKNNKFMLFLDTEFFRGTTASALKFPTGKHTEVFEGKNRTQYAVFKADSLNELIDLMEGKLEEKPFEDYLQTYRQRFLDASKGERVICLAMKTDSYQDEDRDEDGLVGSSVRLNTSTANRSKTELVQELVLAQRTSFELYQGALIGDLIYLMDEDGKLYPDAIMTSTKHDRLREEPIKMYKHNDYTFLMMPYDEQDWIALKRISQRMLELMKDLNSFFGSGYNKEGIYDNSLKQLTGNVGLFLEDKKD